MNHEYAISLGGSLMAKESGLDTNFLHLFREFIDKSDDKFGIVTGGGYPTRYYQKGLKELSVSDGFLRKSSRDFSLDDPNGVIFNVAILG